MTVLYTIERLSKEVATDQKGLLLTVLLKVGRKYTG